TSRSSEAACGCCLQYVAKVEATLHGSLPHQPQQPEDVASHKLSPNPSQSDPVAATKMAASMLRSSVGKAGVCRTAPKARSVRVAAAVDRPVWFPGNAPPPYLNGELAGDYGFDPLRLSSDDQTRKWFVHAELMNARWAMLGVAGILFTSIGRRAGAGFPDWYDAGKVYLDNGSSPIPLATLTIIELILFGFVETKRLYDFRNPGSQGDGSFLGITDGFKGKENGYPGGLFDPLGFSRGDAEQYKQYKIKAMIAFVGFIAQHHATGKSPIDNLFDHLADPYHNTFATNGVSVPHFTEFQ
ncbi:hypothetical protein QJQ45_026242, partial [Haematococcus lacustris]